MLRAKGLKQRFKITKWQSTPRKRKFKALIAIKRLRACADEVEGIEPLYLSSQN